MGLPTGDDLQIDECISCSHDGRTFKWLAADYHIQKDSLPDFQWDEINDRWIPYVPTATEIFVRYVPTVVESRDGRGEQG